VPGDDEARTSEAIAHAAHLVDAAGDAKSNRALDEAEEALDGLDRQSLPRADQARLHYYRANLWSHRSALAGARQLQGRDGEFKDFGEGGHVDS
jgi:hypothetical protein